MRFELFDLRGHFDCDAERLTWAARGGGAGLAQNETKAKPARPERVRSMEESGVASGSATLSELVDCQGDCLPD